MVASGWSLAPAISVPRTYCSQGAQVSLVTVQNCLHHPWGRPVAQTRLLSHRLQGAVSHLSLRRWAGEGNALRLLSPHSQHSTSPALFRTPAGLPHCRPLGSAGRAGVQRQADLVNPASSRCSCVTLGRSLNFTGPQLSLL